MYATFRAWLALALPFALFGCDGAPAPSDAGVERPVILGVEAPTPVLEGSILVVRGLALDTVGTDPRLRIVDGSADIATLPSVMDFEDGRLFFSITDEAVSRLGTGSHAVGLVVRGDSGDSEPFPYTLEIADALAIELADVPQGEVHRNDVIELTGDGYIAPTEGDLRAHFVGTFTEDAGPSRSVDTSIAVTLMERTDRSRGLVRLTTDIGGPMPGTFDGSVELTSALVSGATSTSRSVDTTLHFNPPDLFGLDPTTASLGQIIRISGAGFLGGADRPDETTILRVQGTFTPEGATTGEAFGPTDIVPLWISGNEVQLIVDAEARRDALVASLFGYARGVFMGTATPIAIAGTVELTGVEVPFGFSLGPVRQVVYVRFLPGFYGSLVRFGLHNARDQIELAVQERMRGIYAQWNVDLRFEEPDDFSRTAYSVLEIGGPDPNGSGLFGYDNTPGKDIGNLRLFDQIGGANAETQLDGYPGFGGVFVESFLYWSENPGFAGDRPPGAPSPEPLFDEVFGPVRERPATRDEVNGDGDPDRVAAVRRAIDALGSIVGETSSHELGHSLGMAQPYGSPTAYHNGFDGDGCLMDSGGDRPLGERMGLPGFTPTHFCYDHPDYLDEILGTM
ncbi:MAG: hypothetical protein AB7S26_10890 [Sandaracinaceae bacterium]